MNAYKVTFENNRAISSNRIDLDVLTPIKIEHFSNQYQIKWMTIYANSPGKSIYVANAIAANIISLLSPL